MSTARLAPEAPGRRLAEACALISRHYGIPSPPADRPAEALAFLAEAVAAVLDELPATAAPGRRTAENGRSRSQHTDEG